MKKIVVDSKYFSIKDTLECGQIFRFRPYEKGYLVFSKNKCAYCYNEGDSAIINCADNDEEYFYNFFDLGRDYSVIVNAANNFGIQFLSTCANQGKGIRILNQNTEETLFSFIVSQNNNIPRIKGSIEKLCAIYGEKIYGEFGDYFAFPCAEKLAEADENSLKSAGLGYRVTYIKSVANEIVKGFSVDALKSLSTTELKYRLISLKGVGEKVADCVTLFGFHRADSFPVDTWIEKVYKENFDGKETDRKKITTYFLDKFGENSGYFQQYLFYYKRSLEPWAKEKKNKK